MPEIIGKLLKSDGKVVSEIEKQVSQALVDLENVDDLQSQLKELYIVGVKEVELGNKSAIIIYVPVPQLKAFHKIHHALVRELEKKFGGRDILVLAKRRILPKPQRGSKARPQKQKRPRSRTLTAVHEAWLDELVYPAEVVGRRIRVKLDGKKVYKVHLDKGHETNVEHKVGVFASVYRKLTGKDVVFEFPEPIF
uniref:40S ribosomal protein S7 n=1 Tax=Caenorhabditis japonica TaxID=281687 RepID=A0A8R1DFI3_CAEJA